MKVDIQHNRENDEFYSVVYVSFSNEDFWNLDQTLAHINYHAIKCLYDRFMSGEYVSGYPSNLVNEEEYAAILQHMVYTFNELRNNCPNSPLHIRDFPTDTDEIKAHMDAIKEYEDNLQLGLDYYSKYFRHLWE